LKALEDDTLAKHDLPHQLKRLGEFAQECVKDAESVKEQFAAWQRKAEEIRRVCTNTEGTSSVQFSFDLGKRSLLTSGRFPDRPGKCQSKRAICARNCI
jgi:hypothetical protein